MRRKDHNLWWDATAEDYEGRRLAERHKQQEAELHHWRTYPYQHRVWMSRLIVLMDRRLTHDFDRDRVFSHLVNCVSSPAEYGVSRETWPQLRSRAVHLYE